jgi:Family of unknown function (DUF6275)
MTDIAEIETAQTEVPKAPKPLPPQRKKRVISSPEQFLALAKQMAVRNFNASRDPDRSKAITEDQVYVLGFSKIMSHWRAQIASLTARNLLWDVTYNAAKNQVYIDAFRKVSNNMTQLGEDDQ